MLTEVVFHPLQFKLKVSIGSLKWTTGRKEVQDPMEFHAEYGLNANDSAHDIEIVYLQTIDRAVWFAPFEPKRRCMFRLREPHTLLLW